MSTPLRIAVVAALLLIPALAGAGQAAAEEREIAQVKGNLYRVRVGDQHTLFLATSDGIVLVDPLSLETAAWLKEEFEQRFPSAATVRYVLHTTHRFDRAEGASTFARPAEIIGHREFNRDLSAARHDGVDSIPISDRVRAKDRNGDGRVTAEELYRRVRDVESIFDARRQLSIGGATIELVSNPVPDAPENAIINFLSERIAFASENPPLDGVPFTFGSWKPSDTRRWLAKVAALQFETLLLADGTSVPKTRIARLSNYVNDLVARVADGYEGGGSAASFTETDLPQAYRSDATFRDWRSNVADVYDHVSVFRADATVGGVAHYPIRYGSYCDASTTCSGGGIVPAAAGSVSFGSGRWAAVGEFMVSNESFTGSISRFVDEDFALVETRTSFLARYSRPAGSSALRLLGGMSYTIGDRSGVRRIKEGLAPFAGRHPLHSHETRWGYTGGVDFVFGRNFGVVIPLRFTYSKADSSGTFPHRMDAQAGLALTFRLVRTVD